MHYRNGREARNGDKVVQLTGLGGAISSVGILYDATPGNDHCNGYVAPTASIVGACLVDCLHMDDLIALLAEKGLNVRPAGK